MYMYVEMIRLIVFDKHMKLKLQRRSTTINENLGKKKTCKNGGRKNIGACKNGACKDFCSRLQYYSAILIEK